MPLSQKKSRAYTSAASAKPVTIKSKICNEHESFGSFEDVVAQWYNPLTLQPEQSGGVGSSPGRTPPFKRHDKGSWTRLALSYFCDPRAWR